MSKPDSNPKSLHKKYEPDCFQPNYLTRQDIADFASISPESVIKFLKEFEKEGILKLEGREISIVDPHKLSIISKTG